MPTSTRRPADRARLAAVYATPDPDAQGVRDVIEIMDRTGARDYTRDAARRYRDEALAELDAAGVVQPAVRERLEQIIVGAISA